MHVNLYLYYILCVLNDSEKKHMNRYSIQGHLDS